MAAVNAEMTEAVELKNKDNEDASQAPGSNSKKDKEQ
jgi:hypothetical protein